MGMERGLTRGRALRFFGLAQGFVDDHLQVGLVAQAAFGGLDAGFIDVFGVEADVNGEIRSRCV